MFHCSADGSPWYPKPNDRICSAHFIGGKKADEQDSPSYVPRLFPDTPASDRVKANLAMSRYKRSMERRKNKEQNTGLVRHFVYVSTSFEIKKETPNTKIDKGCQVVIFSEVQNEGKTFICNRYIYNDKEICDSEVQTEIPIYSKIIKCDKRTKDQGCNTKKKIYTHQATITEKKYFTVLID